MTATHLHHAGLLRVAAIRISLVAALLCAGAFAVYRAVDSFRAEHRVGPAVGPKWRQSGLAGVTVHALATSNGRVGFAFAGTEPGVYRRDPGGSWRRVLRSQAVWAVQLLPDDHTVVAGDNAGNVNVSVDAGVHWRRTLVTSQGVYAVAARPGRPSWLLSGTGGGIYLSRDQGRTWVRRLALRGSGVDAFAWEPDSDRVVFAGSVAGTSQARTGAFVSRDAGLTWQRYGRNLRSPAGVMSLLVTRPAHLFAGTMGNAVWLARGEGSAWKQITDGMPPTGDHVAALTTIPGRSDTLFAATLGSGVFRSDDGGAHWSAMGGGLSPARNATIVLTVAYSRLTETLEAGTADGVYELSLKARRVKVR